MNVGAKPTVAALDFFGRPIAAKVIELDGDEENETDVTLAPPPKKRVKVFYKYHEGKSCTVARLGPS